MADKTPAKKRPARQQMLEGLIDTEKQVAERKESHSLPEEKVAAKEAQAAVVAANDLVSRGVVQSIGELKSTINKMLSGLSDQLEEQVTRYAQVQKAVTAADQQLKEIYEIQRSASTLTALIELHDRKKTELEVDLSTTREKLEEEMAAARAEWEREEEEHGTFVAEREAMEKKQREREKEEYKYLTTRDQQQAKDKFADEMAKAHKDLAEQKLRATQDLQEREAAIKTREDELQLLRSKVEAAPKELEAAVTRAVKETTARLQQESTAREELLKREFIGEKNVLSTRITAMEQMVKEQTDRIAGLSAAGEKAYTQVQEIAVRAIEGSATAKQVAHLQQLLSEQSRKGGSER